MIRSLAGGIAIFAAQNGLTDAEREAFTKRFGDDLEIDRQRQELRIAAGGCAPAIYMDISHLFDDED